MKAKHGFLLMNSGAPVSTQEVDQQRFLKEISKDHHTTDLPSFIDSAIHPHRAAQSATAYKEIWTDNGAPLIHRCKNIQTVLKSRLAAPVEIAMLYGYPNVMSGIGKLLDIGVQEICLLPLFPQYSVETIQSCIDKVRRELRERKSRAILRVIPPFYSEPAYTNAIANKLLGIKEHVLFSYRGLSLRHLTKPDKHGHCMSSMECCHEPSAAHDTCYRFQCLKTTRMIAKNAGLDETQYSIAFDSDHGPVKCIEPYTQDMLRTLATGGHTKLAVICPSHFCDSVETLDRIELHGKEIFMNTGGESFRMIHGLNDSTAGIQCLDQFISTWSEWPAI